MSQRGELSKGKTISSVVPWGLAGLLLLMICSVARAAEPSFQRDVQPILSEHCYQCHGPDEEAREADLRLDDRDSLLEAVGDDPIDSELLRRIVSDDEDDVMPPPDAKHPLDVRQIGIIRDWIRAGATWEAHWSFVRPTRPPVPKLDETLARFARNPIDAFVLRKLQQEGLSPNPPAAPEQWLRRVTLDLTGYPPTIREIDGFLERPFASRPVVDRLLASPRFGERMAMDWLDAARYADTNGYQGDRERTMWPWRDWVVAAFNRNLPYDEFTLWQLAGDLLPNATFEQKLATGFCRNHMINGEGGRIAEENRVEYIFDQIETVGTVWMGLTTQCARCHDHKFDPLTQQNYYQLFAFFNQTPINGGGGDPQMAPNLTVVPELQKDTLAQKEASARAALEGLELAEQQCQSSSDEEVSKALQVAIAQRTDDQWKILLNHFDKHQKTVASLMRDYRDQTSELAQMRRRFPKVMVMQDRGAQQPRETYILNKGLYNQRRDTVTAATPAFLPSSSSDVEQDRLALARWLVSPEHPLTARVTVNRIWQLFFGTGLVKTTEDFGVQGDAPSHPELLDWLAVELVESGWELKHVVRLIVSSATYQQSSHFSKEDQANDPENRFLARGPRRRMPAWMIRDHALLASGIVSGEIGGPSVKPYQPQGIWAEASFGNKRYEQDDGESLYRRSLYTYWRRIVGPTMFFDMARRQTCSVRTAQTNTPLHALITLNDITYVEAARLLAQRIMRIHENPSQRLELAFRIGTSRQPTGEEVELLKQRQIKLQQQFAADSQAAQRFLEVGESSPPAEFLPEELASYSAVCLMILNLDEALSK